MHVHVSYDDRAAREIFEGTISLDGATWPNSLKSRFMRWELTLSEDLLCRICR